MPDISLSTARDERWDVVVVGAGPAGSTAARVAAEAGARTLIIDRAVFPRYKTCGGGLLGVSMSVVPSAVLRTVEAEISEVVFTLRGDDPVRVSRKTPFLGMVQRERFDAALVEEAVRAGAKFQPGVALKSLSEEAPGVVRLQTTAGPLQAKCVVGGDGSSGRVGRYVGVIPAHVDLGLEEELRVGPDASAVRPVRLDWGPGPGSYAWVFPKTSVDTVGVIETRGNADRTRAYLREWISKMEDPGTVVDRSSGHLTQWRDSRSPLVRGSVLVAGDAAGLLEPWTREGISFALRSGAFAGAAAAGLAAGLGPAALTSYVQRVEEELQPEIRVGAVLFELFSKRPALVHLVLKHSRKARTFFVEFCAGETSLGKLENRRWFMRIISALS